VAEVIEPTGFFCVRDPCACSGRELGAPNDACACRPVGRETSPQRVCAVCKATMFAVEPHDFEEEFDGEAFARELGT
jgi:hypothetical protein